MDSGGVYENAGKNELLSYQKSMYWSVDVCVYIYIYDCSELAKMLRR